MLDVTLQPQEREPIDVLLVGRSAHPVRGIRLHRVRSIAHPDLRWRHGIPLVSPARALLALSGELEALELEAALVAALGSRVVRPSQVHEVLARNPLAPGAAVLRDLMHTPGGLRDTRSRYERRLLHLLREAGLPAPAMKVDVARHDVDMYSPDLNLVIEFDGWQFHRDRRSFEHDRQGPGPGGDRSPCHANHRAPDRRQPSSSDRPDRDSDDDTSTQPLNRSAAEPPGH